MRTSRTKLPYYLIFGGLFLLVILGGVWLGVRLPLFQSASYISLYGRPSAREIYQGQVLWLSAETEVRQDFVARYPGLFQVSVLLTGQRPVENDVAILFYLKETCRSPANLREVTVTIPKQAVNGGDLFYPFTFAPIDGSAEQHFCFVLEPLFEQGDEENLLGVWASRGDVYAAGSLFYKKPPATIPSISPAAFLQTAKHKVFLPFIRRQGPENLRDDVGFQLHYNGRLWPTFKSLLIHLSEYKPYFWGEPGFYIFLLLLYVSLFFLLLRTGGRS